MRRLAAVATATATAALALPAGASAQAPGTRPLATAPIPSAVGGSTGGTFIVDSAGVPPTVGRARFELLARTIGRRWRLVPVATHRVRPRTHNGRDEVGFAAPGELESGVLGATLVRLRPGARARRVCTSLGCQRRYRRADIVERDILLAPGVAWQPGPALPTRAQIDLESVLIHEMGHFAGNPTHVPRGCRNTPMVVALAAGEWWHSPTDFSYRACSRTA
jgi:hypothetical protein